MYLKFIYFGNFSGLCCCIGFLLVTAHWSYFLVAMPMFLIEVASLVGRAWAQ